MNAVDLSTSINKQGVAPLYLAVGEEDCLQIGRAHV